MKYNCPNCNSEEFITEPNQYDVLTFGKEGFITQSTEQIDEFRIFCRGCSKEVDMLKSNKKIVLKKEPIPNKSLAMVCGVEK
jgi:hypothetical protein